VLPKRFAASSVSPITTALIILLIGAVTRFALIASVPMWWDEVWSLWQTQGSFAQTLALTPYDWPPLYYLLLRGWTYLVGFNDVTGRLPSVLCGLIGIALLYRVARRIGGAWAGVLAALLYAVLPYMVYLTVEARGYALLLVLVPLLAWLHLRWLAHPTAWRRVLLYAIVLALCLYTSYTAALLIGLTLLHGALFVITCQRAQRRAITLRWIAVIALFAILLIPLASRLIGIAQVRQKNISEHLAPAEADSVLSNFYGWLAGRQPILLLALLVLASIGLFLWWRNNRQNKPQVITYLLLWAIGAPLIMYVLRYFLLLIAVRYLSYIVPGVILLLALGLSHLPRVIRPVLPIALLMFAVAPFPVELYRPPLSDEKPTRDIVRELGRRYQPGDQIAIDPHCNCGNPVEWSFYAQIYYPGGLLTPMSDSAPARRIWYIADQRATDAALIKRLQTDRVQTEAFGPYYMIATLYKPAPQPIGGLFGDALRYHGADLPARQPLHAGDTFAVNLWWSADAPITLDYSFALYVIAPDGSLVVQTDGGPQGALIPHQTSQWQSGVLYDDQRSLTLPTTLKAGMYTIRLAAYQSWDNARLLPDPTLGQQVDRALVIGTIEVFNY